MLVKIDASVTTMSNKKPPLYVQRRNSRRQKPAFQVVLNSPPCPRKARGWYESVRSAYYGYARWIQRVHNARVLTGLKLHGPPDVVEIVKQSRVLCREYIYNRLRKLGLLSLKLEMQATGIRPTPVSREIQYVGNELETMYPYLYKDLSRQLNVTLSSETIVRTTLENVAGAMLKNSVITWGRVVALFAVAGALAADSVSQGHPGYVNAIVDTFADITKMHLSEWIIKQGGWSEITRTFRTTGEAATIWVLTGMSAFVGLVLTLLLTM